MNQVRQLYFPPLTPLIKLIIISTSVIFLAQEYAPASIMGINWSYLLTLNADLVLKQLYIWQLVTYLFLHASIGHLIFNMLSLYMFGGEIEQLWSSKRLFIFFLVSGAFSGLVGIMNANLIIGASGAISALIVVYGMTFPDRQVYFFGIFPIKMKYFVLLLLVMTLMFSGKSAQGENISHLTHLGGIIFGFLYMKLFTIKNTFARLKEMKQKSDRNRLKKRFRIITNDMVEKDEDIDKLWKHAPDDEDDDNWH